MKKQARASADQRQQIADEVSRGDFDAALQHCDQLLRKGLAGVDIIEQRARCLAGLQRFDEAMAFCRSALKKYRNNQQLIDVLGQACVCRGNFAEAVGCYEQAVRDDPAFARGWFMLGAIHGRLGNSEPSIHCSNRALELEPENIDAHFNLGNAYMCLHRARAAVPHYRRVADAWEDSFEAWDFLGSALHESGQHAEAVPCLERALALRPDSASTRFLLAAARGSGAPVVAPKAYVAGLFDDYADKFEQHLVGSLHYRTPGLLYALAVESLPDGSGESGRFCVLDFGCGTGLCGPLFRAMARQQIGVDLSPGMLEKAREKGVYDVLIEGDLATALAAGYEGCCDLVVGADVYPYIGAMDDSLRQCHALLRSGGLLLISVERNETTDHFVLHNANRYAHSAAYVREAATRAGFAEQACREAVLRTDRGKDVCGYLFVFTKPE